MINDFDIISNAEFRSRWGFKHYVVKIEYRFFLISNLTQTVKHVGSQQSVANWLNARWFKKVSRGYLE